MGFGVGPLRLFVSSGRDGLVVDDLQGVVLDQALQGPVIDIGVGDVTFLIGTEMEYLAPGQRHPDRCMRLVPDGLHGGTSWFHRNAGSGLSEAPAASMLLLDPISPLLAGRYRQER